MEASITHAFVFSSGNREGVVWYGRGGCGNAPLSKSRAEAACAGYEVDVLASGDLRGRRVREGCICSRATATDVRGV
jgi:hypothetical protein